MECNHGKMLVTELAQVDGLAFKQFQCSVCTRLWWYLGERSIPALQAKKLIERVVVKAPAVKLDGMLGSTQVARIFSVTPRTVMNWVANGRLKAVQLPGGHWRFHSTDVNALMEGVFRDR